MQRQIQRAVPKRTPGGFGAKFAKNIERGGVPKLVSVPGRDACLFAAAANGVIDATRVVAFSGFSLRIRPTSVLLRWLHSALACRSFLLLDDAILFSGREQEC